MKNCLSLKAAVRESEKLHIRKVLKACNDDKVKTAKFLEIGLSTLYRKINELKLKGELK